MKERDDPYQHILKQLSLAEREIFKINRRIEEKKQAIRSQIDELLAIIEAIPVD